MSVAASETVVPSTAAASSAAAAPASPGAPLGTNAGPSSASAVAVVPSVTDIDVPKFTDLEDDLGNRYTVYNIKVFLADGKAFTVSRRFTEVRGSADPCQKHRVCGPAGAKRKRDRSKGARHRPFYSTGFTARTMKAFVERVVSTAAMKRSYPVRRSARVGVVGGHAI